ncbi:hypothetical protein D3C77_615610 [compost metagenome]
MQCTWIILRQRDQYACLPYLGFSGCIRLRADQQETGIVVIMVRDFSGENVQFRVLGCSRRTDSCPACPVIFLNQAYPFGSAAYRLCDDMRQMLAQKLLTLSDCYRMTKHLANPGKIQFS